jgi:hypothetical protein
MILALCTALAVTAPAAPVQLQLQGREVRFTLSLRDGHLAGERLERVGGGGAAETDAGFGVELVWNDWVAPGKANNGDVFVRFGARDFTVERHEQRSTAAGEELALTLVGPEHLALEVRYLVPAGRPYLRRQLRVFEQPHPQYAQKVDAPTGHLVHALYTWDALLGGVTEVVKGGGFGQPVAVRVAGGSAFAGLEWPSADNSLEPEGSRQRLRCGQEIGERLSFEGVRGETAILALAATPHVKDAFVRYLADVRVAPLRPYTLYNSWYDLRSAEYPRVQPAQVMNEENVLRIARLVRENMVEKHGITLDAFVLDDGWDVYGSGWDLRAEQFPRGLAPIVAELSRSRTRLGLWLGPTGGYSFHGKRADWYREHGYEVTDNNMLSVAGPRYAALFEKRVTELTRSGVAYFKWDGLQFVDNAPANGVPPGLYGRRVAMKNVIGFTEAVRRINPDAFLNITSGTWLSPWWLRFADQIWMDGGDFGEAEIPSISTRDSSITYRDMVLYEDFVKKGLWFPVSNLMTHGVLKGHIDVEDIGRGEPLSKFADEVVFYLARGVSMHELYIAPDVLDEGEWTVLADSLRWARARFEVLSRGELVGGDPGKSEPYGYVHFAGARGLVAARNPGIAPGRLGVRLDPGAGLDEKAGGLVLERIYPTRWVAPRLYKAGDEVVLPLSGFEAALYELYPLTEAREPLLAGVVFEPGETRGVTRTLTALEVEPGARVLDPQRLAGLRVGGKPLAVEALATMHSATEAWVSSLESVPGSSLGVKFRLASSARQTRVGVLVRAGKASVGQPDPAVTFSLDGEVVAPDRVEGKGAWAWLTTPVGPGEHRLQVEATRAPEAPGWKGTLEAWVVGAQAVPGVRVELTGRELGPARILPPTGRGAGELPRAVKLGEAALR